MAVAPQNAAALTAAVATIEARTSAELVVVVARRTGRGWGLRAACAAGSGWVTTALLCWSPWAFHDLAIPGYTALASAVGFVIGGLPLVVRLLPLPVRERAVRRAARAAFVEEGVHTTPERTGVLVYASSVEGVGAIVADEGVLTVVPSARLDALRVDPDDLPASLTTLGDLLAAALPVRDGDVNRLADAPRFR